ncbi:hypothetical protein QL093DRAFT_2539413 [Fusarium oxysporum]|nr:hypothetical protein QL093DRAFT_2539413 [Fusarium oxysporum]
MDPYVDFVVWIWTLSEALTVTFCPPTDVSTDSTLGWSVMVFFPLTVVAQPVSCQFYLLVYFSSLNLTVTNHLHAY